MLRSLVISQLGKYDHADVIAESKRKFDGHVTGSDPLSSDLKGGVFSITLANGDGSIFDALLKVCTGRPVLMDDL